MCVSYGAAIREFPAPRRDDGSTDAVRAPVAKPDWLRATRGCIERDRPVRVGVRTDRGRVWSNGRVSRRREEPGRREGRTGEAAAVRWQRRPRARGADVRGGRRTARPERPTAWPGRRCSSSSGRCTGRRGPGATAQQARTHRGARPRGRACRRAPCRPRAPPPAGRGAGTGESRANPPPKRAGRAAPPAGRRGGGKRAGSRPQDAASAPRVQRLRDRISQVRREDRQS